MKYTCKICGKRYEYCHSCAITKDVFKNNSFCDKNCYDISMTIQQYRSNVIDVKEAMELLEVCEADKIMLIPEVDKYYQEIKNKAIPIEESLYVEENTSSLTDEDTELLDE